MANTPQRSRGRVLLVIALIVWRSGATVLAAALAPILLRDHPLLLVALDPLTRYLFLVSIKVDIVSLMIVAILHHCIKSPIYYLMGHWYGDKAVNLVKRRAGRWRDIVGAIERLPSMALAIAVLVFPSALVSILAGSGKMRFQQFIALYLVGLSARIVSIWLVANAMSKQFTVLVNFIDRNATWLTFVSTITIML